MWLVDLTPTAKLIGALVYAQRWPVLGAPVRTLLLLRGTDIAPAAVTAPGLRLPHGAAGVVVHRKTRLGRNVTVYQGVTVGRADVWRPEQPGFALTIDDDVIIGAGAVIMSGTVPVRVGRGAVIGANAVVTRSVPAGEIWAGAPARKVGEREPAPVSPC